MVAARLGSDSKVIPYWVPLMWRPSWCSLIFMQVPCVLERSPCSFHVGVPKIGRELLRLLAKVKFDQYYEDLEAG